MYKVIPPNEDEGLRIFSEIISNFSENEEDEFFEAMKEIRGKDLSFSYDNITVYNDYVIIDYNGQKYGIVTDHAYLELERIRKNRILRSSVNKTVKVVGVVGNVKMYSNTALFCLSPCIINETDIGHTWTRYSPAFKNIKYGSTICFYSEIKTYGDLSNKSGVNWQEITYIRMKGGDNSPFYKIPLKANGLQYATEWLDANEPDISPVKAYREEIGVSLSSVNLNYVPAGRDTFNLRRLRFQDDKGINIAYHPFEKELVFNSKYAISPEKETQNKIDSLLLFEWMAKLEDWEFWGYTKNA